MLQRCTHTKKKTHCDSLKLFLRLPAKVPHQPLISEGILGRHPITHHGVQESLPLSGIKAQNLSARKRRSNVSARRRKNSDFVDTFNTLKCFELFSSAGTHLDVPAHSGQQWR